MTKTASTSSATASGGTWRIAAIALIVLPSAISPSSSSSAGGRFPAGTTGRDQRLDDGRIQGGAAGGHRADGVDQLAALGDVVFQQVAVAGRTLGQQRDRVLGLLVLRQHHDPGAGMALAHLPGGVDALAAERRRHPDVGHDHLGLGGVGAADELVVIGGHPDDLKVAAGVDEGTDSLAHDQVVVRQEDADRAGRAAVVIHVDSCRTRAGSRPESRHASVRWW